MLEPPKQALAAKAIRGYYLRMLQRMFALPMLALMASGVLASDIIQLKDKAAVSGTILVEKPDQVVVDLGYTVLVIPREKIASIAKGAESAPAQTGAARKTGKSTRKPSSAPAANPQPAETAPTPSQGQGQAQTQPAPPKTDKEDTMYTGAAGNQGEKSVRELVNQLGEAVVQVRTPSGLGSGFFINEEGYLVTNFHVIEGETQISVEVYHQKNGQLERRNYRQVRIVAIQKFNDLSLLKIEDAGATSFLKVPLAQPDGLSVGERVFAIGSPLGLERTVTEGIVSTKTRQMQGELYLQTTAQINPGNSGGPLFNLRGEVVGVINMKLTFGEGLGFAIPVDTLRYFLNHRDAFAYDNDNPSNAYRYLEPPSRLKQAAVGTVQRNPQ